MSDLVPMTPEARWQHLRTQGMKLLIDLESNEKIADKPSWLDEVKYAKAREAIQKYFLGVSYSSFTGLLLILQLPEGLEPLLSTGNSKDIPSLYRRYLATIVHVRTWYDDDVFDPKTVGYRSIRQVRGMHKRVQGLMNDKFKVRSGSGDERKWMSQYDMALTQFAFIGLAMIYPKRSALIAATHEELELINYYWRILGWLMGIEDKFNACQFDKYEDILAFNKLILQHEYLDKFKANPCEKGLAMTKSICVALHYFMPLIEFNSLAYWWKDQLSFNGYQIEPLTGRQRLLDLWTRISFNHLLKWEPLLRFSTKLHKRKFDARYKNKDKIYEKLQAQYKDNQNFTYYSDRVDYFNRSEVVEQPSEPFAVPSQQQDDDNNNNNTEQVHTKSPLAPNLCPFGYGSTKGVEATIVSPQMEQQAVAPSA